MAGQETRDNAAESASTAAMTRKLSDSALRERTGRGWDEWFGLLDDWGGTGRTHTEIARWLTSEHGMANWWAQSVTVGYEQAQRKRQPGQRSGGGFAANISRSVAVPVDRLFEAFTDESLRQRWLPGVKVRVRTTTAPRTLRADWEDGSRIAVWFTPKDEKRSQLALMHEKLAGSEAVAEAKTYWRERLAVLKELLEQTDKES
jgi:hypothetical protein